MELTNNFLLQNEMNRIHVQILHMAYAKLDTRWHASRCTSSFTRVYLINKGRATIRCKSREVTLLPGNIYLIPPGLEFDFWCDNTMEKLFYHINILRYNNYDLLSGHKDFIVLEDSTQAIENALSAWSGNNILSAITLKEQLYNIILKAIDRSGIDPGGIETYSDYVKDAIRYIERNLSATLSAEQIACCLFISKSRLQKDFSREVGIPLRRYINDRLMVAAGALLREQNRSVKQVSEQLGFCDQFYFSRRFRLYFGIPPTAYRKNIQL